MVEKLLGNMGEGSYHRARSIGTSLIYEDHYSNEEILMKSRIIAFWHLRISLLWRVHPLGKSPAGWPESGHIPD